MGRAAQPAGKDESPTTEYTGVVLTEPTTMVVYIAYGLRFSEWDGQKIRNPREAKTAGRRFAYLFQVRYGILFGNSWASVLPAPYEALYSTGVPL